MVLLFSRIVFAYKLSWCYIGLTFSVFSTLAIEEDSGMEAAPNTITINITFHDGTEANIPFRLDQTIRDIQTMETLAAPKIWLSLQHIIQISEATQ